MRRNVHVQQQIIANLVQQPQTRRILTFVELEDNVAQLRFQFEEQLERTARDDVLLDFGAIEGGQRAQSPVHGHVVRRNQLREFAVIEAGLQEMLGRRFVLLGGQLGQTGGALETRQHRLIGVLAVSVHVLRSALRLGHVAQDVRPVLQIDRHLDHVQTHIHHMFPARAIVPGSGIALQCVRQIAAVQVMIAQIVVTAANALLDRVRLVVLEIVVEFLQFQGGLLAFRFDPDGVEGWDVALGTGGRGRGNEINYNLLLFFIAKWDPRPHLCG